MARRAARASGFTMIELMLTIVIVGILVTVAVYGYARSIRKARSAEVVAMFGELKAKEDAYKTENYRYLAVPLGDTSVWPTLRVTPGMPLQCKYGVDVVVPTGYTLRAECDWDNDPSVNATYTQESDSTAIAIQNDLR